MTMVHIPLRSFLLAFPSSLALPAGTSTEDHMRLRPLQGRAPEQGTNCPTQLLRSGPHSEPPQTLEDGVLVTNGSLLTPKASPPRQCPLEQCPQDGAAAFLSPPGMREDQNASTSPPFISPRRCSWNTMWSPRAQLPCQTDWGERGGELTPPNATANQPEDRKPVYPHSENTPTTLKPSVFPSCSVNSSTTSISLIFPPHCPSPSGCPPTPYSA